MSMTAHSTWVPLATLNIVRFVEQLSVAWRRGKILQREYLRRAGLPHPTPRTSYSSGRPAGLRRHGSASLLARLLGEGMLLADTGIHRPHSPARPHHATVVCAADQGSGRIRDVDRFELTRSRAVRYSVSVVAMLSLVLLA